MMAAALASRPGLLALTRPSGRRTLLLALVGLLAALWLSDITTTAEQPAGMVPAAASIPTAAPPPSAPSADPEEEECGWVDPGCHARKAMTDWLGDLAMAGLKPVLGFLAHTGYATPEIGSPPMKQAEQIWGASLTIANTSAVLLVTLGGVLLLTGSSPIGQPSPASTITRLAAGFIAANTSLIVIGYAIQLVNGLSEAILLDGADTIDPSQAGKVLAHGIEAAVQNRGAFYGVVSLVVVGLATVLLVQYLLRLAIIMILIGIAPLALILHSLELTDPIARLWWRGIAGVLAIQVCQSFVFVTTLGLMFSQDSSLSGEFYGIPTDQAELLNLLLITALLWVLLRIPSMVSRSIWQSTPGRPRIVGQLIRTFLLYKGVGAIGTALKGKSAAGAGGQRRAPGGGRRRPPPGPNGRGPGRRGPGGRGPRPGGRSDGPRPQPGERPNRPSGGDGPRRPRNNDSNRPDGSGRRPGQSGQQPQGQHRDRPGRTGPYPPHDRPRAPHTPHRPPHQPSRPDPRQAGPWATPAPARATMTRAAPRAPSRTTTRATNVVRPRATAPPGGAPLRLDPPRRSRTHRHGRA